MKKTLFFTLPFLLVLSCSAARVGEGPSSAGKVGEVRSPEERGAARDATVRGAGPSRQERDREPLAGVPFRPLPAPTAEAAAPEAPKEPPATWKPAEDEKYVSLNFDNAEIGVVIQTIADLIGLNYIVSPGVSGRVTIQSSTKIPVSSLFTVLEEILEVNSLTAVRAGDFYKIVPTAQARQKEIETVIGDAAAAGGQQVITKVVPLDFISPTEVVKILNPLKSPAGVYYAHDPTRLLFMTDSAKKIAEMMKIVEILDVDTFARIQVELYPVKYADAEELARELTQVVTTVFASAGRGRSVFRIIAVTQINALMIISGEPGLARNIISWVTKMDQPAQEASEQIFVYPLAHAKAEEIASVLNQIFKSDSEGAARSAAREAESPDQQAAPGRRQPTAPARQALSSRAVAGSAATGIHTVTIVPDKATNALVIQTAAWFYPVVEETIRKLDQLPRQVLIEVLIAEITLDDETQFGLQWIVRGQGSASAGGESLNLNSQVENVFATSEGGGLASLAPGGFSWVLTEANRITALLDAYAKKSKLNILSSPHIMAADNMEATINVGSEIPIITTQTTEGAGGVTPGGQTFTNQVEYRDTGVILNVTPHINEGRYVTLDVKQEISQAQTNELGGTESPIIRKRTAQTTMVVKDNQTLVIGGLIGEQKDRSREGIPYLSEIPILGYLFSSTTDKVSKTELVLLITPRVITTPEEGNRVSRMLRDRVLTLKEGIEIFTDLPGGGEGGR